MRSTYFEAPETMEPDYFLEEPENEKPDSPGFLAVMAVMFVIYAVTARPILYDLLKKWLSQLLRIVLS